MIVVLFKLFNEVSNVYCVVENVCLVIKVRKEIKVIVEKVEVKLLMKRVVKNRCLFGLILVI